MWALLDYDNITVVGCFTPDVDMTLDDVKKEINGRTVIEMTIENSPARIGDVYKDGKFYSTKEVING
jgi:hypothetical protein